MRFGAAFDRQVERVVGDQRVGVDAAVVVGAREPLRVVIRIAERLRVRQRAQASRPHDVLADEVVGIQRRRRPAAERRTPTLVPMMSENASFSAPDSLR